MRHNESQLQRQCVAWFRLQHPRHTIFAIPNGGKRGVVEARIMKGEGVLAGVADLFVMAARGKYHGLFIEMKSGAGRLQPSQLDFGLRAITEGYQHEVVRRLDEFMRLVNGYLDESSHYL